MVTSSGTVRLTGSPEVMSIISISRGGNRRPIRRERERVTAETKRVRLRWEEGLVFRGGEPEGPETTIDGDNTIAPGPMLTPNA